MGRQSIWEYFRSVYARYRQAAREAKRKILGEFCANTKYNRKYTLRLLNGPPPGRVRPHRVRPPRRRPTYGTEFVRVLKAIWQAAGYPWSVRLKALIPLWMPWVRKHFRVSAELERQLLAISTRQIDRRLRPYKTAARRRVYGGTRPGRLLKHPIPLRLDRWDARVPGITEVDLVAHSGDSGEGEFAYTLNVTLRARYGSATNRPHSADASQDQRRCSECATSSPKPKCSSAIQLTPCRTIRCGI